MDDTVAFFAVSAALGIIVMGVFVSFALMAICLLLYGLMLMAAAVYRAFGGKDWRDECNDG